jgi:hypothetical protein
MKTLIKTKLIDENHIEIRDYELHQQPLRVIHCTRVEYKFCDHLRMGEEFMILSLAQQNKGKFLNTQQSKFPPYKYYGIYKFLWKPQKPPKDIDQPVDMTNAYAAMPPHIRREIRIKLGLPVEGGEQ